MIKLSFDQKLELKELLGHDPSQDRDWAIVNDDNGPCIYAINSKGTIVVRLTCTDRSGRLQKPRKCSIREFPDHYLFCSLNSKDIRLHRIMASTWLDDWDPSLTVNHKDGNKHNNSIENLEMMTVNDNCMYYHSADCIREQRQRDYAHHGDTIRGRIHITDGTQAKMIHESDGIPEGWWRGRPQSMKDKESASTKGRPAPNSNKRMITDGNIVKYIDSNADVPEGWSYGGINNFSEAALDTISERMKGRIYIHKGELNKRVYSHQLAEHLSQGWELGMYAEHLDPHSPKCEEFRNRMHEIMKGEGNPMFGKHLSEEHRAKISASNKGKKHTEEAKKKISEAKKGYQHTDEAKEKMSNAMKGRSPGNKGFIWITNGSDNKQISESELVDYPGYRKGITREKIERTYVNDGHVNHKIPVSELDEWLSNGYVKGMLKNRQK